MSIGAGQGLSDDLLSKLSELIAEKTALHFPRDRWNDLERRVAPAAAEFGFADKTAFVQWLLSSPLTREQIEILASHLTISETYFWREPRVFEALVEHILPDLIRSKINGPKTLRFWSAGCAGGEEPYSIAMALRRVIPDLKDWRVTILATDLNPRILKKAKVGVFREWSFRNAPPWIKKEHFRDIGGGRYEINPEIREMVAFAYLNLAENVYPSPLNGAYGMDVVFCRNVLMYFAPERARKVRQGLYNSLVDGGWLMVGASELSQNAYAEYTPAHFEGAIVYRKEGGAALPPLKIRVEETPPAFQFTEIQIAPLSGNVKVFEPIVLPPEEPAVVKVEPKTMPPAPAGVVRAMANRGKLTEALAACEEALAADKLDPELHYLRATILQEQNQEGDAGASFKRAIYLAPDFVPAHFSLGNLLLRRGAKRAAMKCFDNVIKILSAHGRDEVLPDSEGLTAGRLMEIVRATMDIGALA